MEMRLIEFVIDAILVLRNGNLGLILYLNCCVPRDGKVVAWNWTGCVFDRGYARIYDDGCYKRNSLSTPWNERWKRMNLLNSIGDPLTVTLIQRTNRFPPTVSVW